jgi:N-acetylmuramoyl-L-alanine amidase
MRHIDKIIIHCSATPEFRDVTTDDLYNWHVVQKGWSDIGYHFFVDLKGRVHECRPIERQGAHVRGLNKNSIGICYAGGLSKQMAPKDTRNEAQKRALDLLIYDLLDEHTDATLHGHNEFSSKACPSFDVQKEYKDTIDYYNECNR